jgi:crossover junction endodeoxyribonuclease RuvC
LQSLLKTSMADFPMDATDALASAVCHHFNNSGKGVTSGGSKVSGWAAFIKQNPDRKV